MPRRPPTRLETLEAWWALLARIFAFLLGAAVLVWQNVAEDHAQSILVGAALVLMVPATVAALRGLLTSVPSEVGRDGRS